MDPRAFARFRLSSVLGLSDVWLPEGGGGGWGVGGTFGGLVEGFGGEALIDDMWEKPL